MDVVGLEKHEQDEIFKMLAVVLWLGNLLFVENDDGNAAISDPDGKKKKQLMIRIGEWYVCVKNNMICFFFSCQFYCILDGSGW